MNSFKTIAVSTALVVLTACVAGLPPSVRREVSLEDENLQTAEHEVAKSEAALDSDLSQAPDLFNGASEPAAWKASLSVAKTNLQAAENDGRELEKLVKRNRPDPRIAQLLADERSLRQTAVQKAQAVDQAAGRWLEYKHDPAAFAAKIKTERASIQSFDFSPVTQAVHRAEQDWPQKKPVLESRLSSLTSEAKVADAPDAASPSVLIAEEETLSRQAGMLGTQAHELQSECGQLYDSWDKILTDLDRPQYGPDTLYRERIKTVRTHWVDVPLKKTETHSDEHWTDVSPAAFHSVEDDIGMAIAHKDAGLFDSEAQNTPQPPGFSYVASPSVGSNQYGYWSHNGGESVWTFLPQYLILRELLWNHDYRPVVINEYNAYHVAQSRGTTYYGRATPNAAPTYGTHGTFTQSHYADSRYVQSGGFRGSAYASGGAGAAGSASKLNGSPHVAGDESGRRFGRQPGAAPSGQHFGHAPSARPPGRSFGRRH